MIAPRTVTVDDSVLEIFDTGPGSGPTICAAHPAELFDGGTAGLLAEAGGGRVVCVNPRGSGDVEAGPSLERMVDRVEEVRRRSGIGPWLFWGMSGGGWLAQIYANRHPESLTGVVIESACLCFRERLADPECVLSPFFAAWRQPLAAAGLLSEGSHADFVSGDETEWIEVGDIGSVFRRRQGPALLVSPGPLSPEMKAVMPRLWEHDSRPWIGSIRVPVLVVCGSADPVVPVRHARAVREAIPGSSFVEVEGGGHVPTAERRPEVADAFRRFVSDLRR